MEMMMMRDDGFGRKGKMLAASIRRHFQASDYYAASDTLYELVGLDMAL